MRTRRVVLIVGIVLVLLVAIVTGTIAVMTNTDWGRERVRRFVVSTLGKNTHGFISIGQIEGNLLTGITVHHLRITDSTRAPFVEAEMVRARYTLDALWHKRIYLDNVTVLRPVIVLDRPPHGRWNYDRIFPHDTTHRAGPPGLGSWVRFTNLRAIDGHLTIRSPWAPDTALTTRQQDSAVAYNLGPKGRQQIVRVPGGFQRVMDFQQLSGTFPLVRWADPSDKRQIIDVASLRTIAAPMRPPTVTVNDVRGRFVVLDDSLFFHGVALVLAGSRAVGDGRYNIDNNDLRLRLHADPVATNDLLWIDPTIPHNGVGAMDFALDWVGKTSDYLATNASLRVAGATLTGSLGVQVTDTLLFHDTDLHITRLDTRTIQQLFPSLASPIQGYLTGQVAAAGSVNRMRVQGDMTFDTHTGRSRAIGRADYALGRGGHVNANLRLAPLSLATVGHFAPAAGLHGNVRGPVRVNGSLQHLAFNAALTTPDGGSLNARGTTNLASRTKSYDVVLATHLFDASQVSTHAPRTNVTADASVRGSGTTAETVNAVLAAKFRASMYDSVAIDSAVVRVAAASGVLRVDTLSVRVPHGMADARGTFGLTDAHSGTLSYAARIDSLGALSRFIPPDTGVMRPRPGIAAERVQRSRQDSVRVAEATRVQRAISGHAPPPAIKVDTPAVIERAALRGAIDASGTMRGNVRTFDMQGTARGTGLVALGNSANVIQATYTWEHALTPQSRLAADVRAGGLFVKGFALDSVIGQASYQHPNGTVVVTVHQGTGRIYQVNAAYVLNRVRSDVLLNNLRLQFDTVVYASAHASRIHFGSAGFDIDSLDLRSPQYDSRLFVNGRVPTSGAADVQVTVRNLDVGNVVTLLESDVPARGFVSADVHLTGTSADPTIRGAIGTHRLVYNGTLTPEVHGTLDYAAQTLRADIQANIEGEPSIIRAAGTVPVNLALTGVTGSRVPANRAVEVRIDADSLPLDRVPAVQDVVSNMRGLATAHIRVGGTLAHPAATGNLLVDNGAVKVIPTGITYTAINASLRLLQDSIAIDSIVARSRGPIRLAGGIGLDTLSNPFLGLQLTAHNTHVLDNDQGDVRVDAALKASGFLKQARVEGDVRLREGVIYIPESSDKQLVGASDPALFSVLDTAVASNRDLFPRQSPIMRNLRASVNVSVDHDVFVRSRDANVEIYTEDPLRVSVNQRRRSIQVDGVVISDRGEYRFQSRRFIIRRGSATFINAPQLNPTLQVTGEYEVQLPAREPITIRIIISGTLLAPKIALESDAEPPIAQTDLLSYLAFGRSSSSLLQFEGSGLTTGGSGNSNIVGRAAALAQQQVASAALGAATDELSGNAARSLGADVLNITPADVSSDVGNFLRATQIEFGKYIQSRTFLGLQVRPDPAALQRPGIQLQRALDQRRGLSLQLSFEPRYLVREPSLSSDLTPQTTSVFGAFLIREWRY